MAQAEPSRAASVTLDQLIALNDEIGALVRAGVPLERGLYELGQDMPGRLGKLAITLAEKMRQGQSLSQALGEQGAQIPPVYRAVVEAGVKSGRLSAALESIAASARRTADARRIVASGVFYPLLVFLLAWGLFVVFAAQLAPRMIPMFADSKAPGLVLLEQFAQWGDTAWYWGPTVPLVVVVLAAVWWFRSSRALAVDPRTAGLLLGWLPWTRSMLQAVSTATFAEVLALLVEHGVPLDEGILLAAEAAGDAKMLSGAREMAAALRRGEIPSRQKMGKDFPPLMDWLLLTGQQRGALLPALRLAADSYRQRAVQQGNLARVLVPVGLTIAVGGTVTLAFALALFAPWISLLKTLALP